MARESLMRDHSAKATLALLVAIAANAGVFVWSNCSVGATIEMKVSWPSGSEDSSIFSFSLGDSVRQMWGAEAYVLAIMIALLSGAWPYVKLMLLVWAWCFPMARESREQLLWWIETLGKWSFVDAFVLSLMAAAFSTTVDVRVGPYTLFETKVGVHPEVGIQTFVLAATASLVISNVVTHRHRAVAGRDARANYRQQNDRVDHLLALVSLGMLAMFFVAAMQPAIRVSMGGWSAQFFGDQSTDIAVGSIILSSLNTSGPAWAAMPIFAIMALTLAVAPVALPLMTLASLLVPKVFGGCAEKIRPWFSLDVLAATIVAASLQMAAVSRMVTVEGCDFVEKETGVACAYFEASILPGFSCLVLVTIFSFLHAHLSNLSTATTPSDTFTLTEPLLDNL